jgi:hypothetical protein
LGPRHPKTTSYFTTTPHDHDASGALSDIDKGPILALYEDGQRISQIAKTVGRPWTKVEDFIRRYNKQDTYKNLKKPEDPPNLANAIKLD